jgi:hypothetical protein
LIRNTTAVLAASFTLLTHAAAEQPAAAPGIGSWTTDYPAALKLAAERKLPLFIEFTGSDWCGWCQKMEKECLSKPEFLEAMKTRCVLVTIDFPHNTKQSPELKQQNNQVADQFKKRGGFPAYYIVDSDAKTVQWRFGAHPKYGKDLNLLISDIAGFCAGCNCVVEQVSKDLPADKAEAYRKAAKAYSERQKVIAEWIDQEHADIAAANKEFEGYVQELTTLRAAMNTVIAPTAG